jgi:hypothetical protein
MGRIARGSPRHNQKTSHHTTHQMIIHQMIGNLWKMSLDHAHTVIEKVIDLALIFNAPINGAGRK